MTDSPVALQETARYRLLNQQVAATKCQKPADVVSSLGAMQAQDYLGTLWAIGLRLPAATEKEVEPAIAERTIAPGRCAARYTLSRQRIDATPQGYGQVSRAGVERILARVIPTGSLGK